MQNWDSLYIYYISGTGNTRLSSQWIAEEAGKRGLKTVVQQIDRLENIVMPAADEKPLTGFLIIMSMLNASLFMFLIETLNIEPEAWWWKILSQLIGIAVMVTIAAILYLLMHYAMGFKPVNYLVRFTSLTTLPFWRRYKYLKGKEKNKSDYSSENRNTN